MLIHTAVANYAASLPDMVAVVSGAEGVTFGDLNRRVKVLAARLRSRGVGPEVLACILLPRSVDVVTSILAVSRAGGAFLVLDPEMPRERLQTLIKDAGPKVIVTAPGMPDIGGDKSIFVHGDEDANSSLPDVAASADNLAYLIYTSGSTGEPKAVEVMHGGLERFLIHMRDELEIRHTDTFAAIASPTFDVSVFELLLPIFCGARVAILPRSAARDGLTLAGRLERHNATLLAATPGTWQMLIDSGWKGRPDFRAISGGEALQPALAAALAERTGALWNHYGPTEATITACSYRVRGGESRVPIGRAIAGLDLQVRSVDGLPVEDGEPGELYISGPGVARGYRNRPDQTAQQFVNVQCDGREVRAYRTGDLVRRNPQGDLEFLGRVDSQIKVRGHRLEPEELEAVLTRHPKVKEAAVVKQVYGPNDVRVAAFVVPADKRAPGAGELRRHLATRFERAVLPNSYIVLQALPKTAHGKVDRQSLATLHTNALDTPAPAAGGRDEVESGLLALWRRMPGFSSVGLDDNFFDFGGHSLLAAKMLLDVQHKFGRALPLATLLKTPTVRELAAVLRQKPMARKWSPLVPIRKEGSRPAFFCIHGIGGNVLNFERLGSFLSPDQPVYGIQARGLDGGVPHSSVEEMAASYIEAVREVQPAGPYLLAGYSAGGAVAFEMARQLSVVGQPVALLALLDASLSEHEPGSRWSRLGQMLKEARHSLGGRNSAYYRWLLSLKLRTAVYAWMKRHNFPMPPRKNVEEAFAVAVRKFRPQPYNGSAVQYCAGRDGHDPTLGWASFIRELDVEDTGSDHFRMLAEPHVRELARSLERRIEQALRLSLQVHPGA
jgi:amino acid adenylation domain-containing protein